jgi:hypothetical protein
MISKVFWVKNVLKNRFFGKKNINPNFPATIVARIQGKQPDGLAWLTRPNSL